MWLAAMATPDHNTINRFRSDKLKEVLKDVFTLIVMLLVNSGHVGLKDINVDGTKIEGNANRYTFVWGNAIKTNKEKVTIEIGLISLAQILQKFIKRKIKENSSKMAA